jgi:hypothetical protein
MRGRALLAFFHLFDSFNGLRTGWWVGRDSLSNRKKPSAEKNAKITRRIPTCPLDAHRWALSAFRNLLTKGLSECQSNEKYHETKLFSCPQDHQGLQIRHEYPHPLPARLEPERKRRFQVCFGGKFCHQFYFVMKMENVITTPPAKWLYGTSAPRCHPCPG